MLEVAAAVLEVAVVDGTVDCVVADDVVMGVATDTIEPAGVTVVCIVFVFVAALFARLMVGVLVASAEA